MELSYRIRQATADDAVVIAHHRATMFREMGLVDVAEAASLEAASFVHLRQMLLDRRYLGWLAECNGEVLAGGGVLVSQLLPRPGVLDGGAAALIMNMYTEPASRRRGLARELMNVILEWCRENRIMQITLHASDEGRPLYESLGFVKTNEMRWKAESSPIE